MKIQYSQLKVITNEKMTKQYKINVVGNYRGGHYIVYVESSRLEEFINENNTY